MNTFELAIWDDFGAKCTFYSVTKEGSDKCETDDFFETFEVGEFENENQILLNLIQDVIGEKYGAIEVFFNRDKNNIFGLPPKIKNTGKQIFEIKEIGFNFPLRLYCLRINARIVILFNGGIKDQRTDQKSQISLKFYEAQAFAKRIISALNDGLLVIKQEEGRITDFQGNITIQL